ncbi:autophagy-related protein 27 [[Candida] anglica]|uniref:Autophagy-related protein 27 n=1 Tax=[Candida] anglica TaxID=148631 RepID=A0ABP0EKM6_9ASCO
MVKTSHIFGFLALLAKSVLAVDCSASELSRYNIEQLKGIHSIVEEKETPPTKTKTTWYVGVCEPAKDEATKKCPADSEICGITEVLINDKYTLTQVISFDSKLTKNYETISDAKGGVRVVYKDATWGPEKLEAKLTFTCPSEDSSDDKDVFKVKNWDGKSLVIEVISNAGCIKDKENDSKKGDGDKKGNDGKEDKGESWGWFTWIFIFMVLFLSIYIIGGAWFQYHKSNAIDFQSALREVLENFIELLSGLPNFIKEIVEKVTGNSNRGGYSAV